MGTAARHITRSSNEGAHTHIAPTTTTEERKAGINCEGDDGERAVEQVITARLLLERRGQSVERHATCTIPMIPREGGTDSRRGNEGDTERSRRNRKRREKNLRLINGIIAKIIISLHLIFMCYMLIL